MEPELTTHYAGEEVFQITNVDEGTEHTIDANKAIKVLTAPATPIKEPGLPPVLTQGFVPKNEYHTLLKLGPNQPTTRENNELATPQVIDKDLKSLRSVPRDWRGCRRPRACGATTGAFPISYGHAGEAAPDIPAFTPFPVAHRPEPAKGCGGTTSCKC